MTFFRIFQYLKYRWRAKNAHGIHSPFVFDFYNQVLHRSFKDPAIEKQISDRYLQNHTKIQFRDPKTDQLIRTTISTLAKKSWSGRSFSYFLLKLCEWLQANCFMETGTSLGIALSVVAHASTLSRLYSIEGSSELAETASKLHFKPPGKTLKIVNGAVRDTFERVLAESKPDVVFLDADHRSETIFFYLEVIKRHKKMVKAIVIHDIYWSEDMTQAWDKIINDPGYLLTIDCFHMGILFPLVEIEKQHFVLKY